jgi:hypothetical protein
MVIVQPDFLTHWKTRKLVNRLKQQQAPLYVIRLWALCQTARRDTVPADAETIAAICEYSGDAEKLYSALLDCRWIDPAKDGEHKVHSWAEINARLLHNWAAGVHGGRPKGTKKETQGKPKGSPIETDRVDREEKIEKTEKKEGEGEPTHAPTTRDVSEYINQHLKDYMEWCHQFGLDHKADRAAVELELRTTSEHKFITHPGKVLKFAIQDAAKTLHMDRTKRDEGWKPANAKTFKSILPP